MGGFSIMSMMHGGMMKDDGGQGLLNPQPKPVQGQQNLLSGGTSGDTGNFASLLDSIFGSLKTQQTPAQPQSASPSQPAAPTTTSLFQGGA
jgi:hypothetical protein